MKKKMNINMNTEIYEYVTSNIYFTGNTYRVRKTINGSRYSKNFTSLRKAKQFLKSL